MNSDIWVDRFRDALRTISPDVRDVTICDHLGSFTNAVSGSTQGKSFYFLVDVSVADPAATAAMCAEEVAIQVRGGDL
jgi:hypothetical protein